MLPHLVLLDLSPFMFLRLRLDPVLLFVVALKHGAGDFGLFCLIILRMPLRRTPVCLEPVLRNKLKFSGYDRSVAHRFPSSLFR